MEFQLETFRVASRCVASRLSRLMELHMHPIRLQAQLYSPELFGKQWPRVEWQIAPVHVATVRMVCLGDNSSAEERDCSV